MEENNKRKRVVLPILEKLEIIGKFEEGHTVKAITVKYNVPEATVRGIIKQKEQLLKFWCSSDSLSAMKKRKAMKKSTYEDLDKALLEWFNNQRALGNPVNGPICAAKAKDIFISLGLEGPFEASHGWLTRFKNRHGIGEHNIQGLNKLRNISNIKSVDSEVASQLDLNSLTSSMKRARKSAFAADIELQDSSGTSNTENAPSTSSTQFTTPAFASVRDPEFGTLEKSGVGQPSSYVPSSTSLPGGTSTQSQGVDGSKGKEKLTSTVTLADLIQTTSTSSTVSYTGGVKVKPIDVLQSKNTSGNAKESISKEVGQPSNINISVRALQSAIQRLETVSNKLVANSRADSYDHFARYISTVLRGLPAKKMHSLKKKIMTEILDALAQEESARLCKNTSKDIQMNLASEITKNYNRKFGTRPSQSTNRPSDPKLLGNEIPIHGNTPQRHASIFNPSSSSQEIPDPVACRSSSAIVTTPSFIGTTSSIVHPVLSEAATTSVDENFMATNIPNPIMSTSFRNDESLVQSPRRRKRRKTTRARAGKKAPSPCETTTSASDYDSSADEQSISCARKGIQSERDLQSQEDSRGSREEDVSIKIPQPMKNEDQDYEMDIEEGNELAQIKEDQDLFETVLCGESSSLYIKEEAPDPEESVEGDPITPPPAPVNPSTTPLTCQICNTQWDSREDLLTHFSITHQKHYPSKRTPKNPKKQAERKRCRVCYREGKERKTLYFCAQCPGEPALCPVPCYEKYHSSGKL